MRSLAIGIGALVLIATSANGQTDIGDASQGRALARKECTECHLVEKHQRDRKPIEASAFQKIADNPAHTGLSLRVFLNSDHRKMPRLILTEAEADNVIAYILSLR